jgi:hypothetical protein
MYSMSFARTPIWWIVGPVAALAAVYIFLASVGLAPTPHTCVTENLETVHNVAGFDFEISETDCSTLGEDSSISVFAFKPGQTGKTLLFKYGPAGVNPMPVITSVDPHTVQISVPRISDLILRRDSWEGLSINYNIGIIDYPSSSPQKNG